MIIIILPGSLKNHVMIVTNYNKSEHDHHNPPWFIGSFFKNRVISFKYAIATSLKNNMTTTFPPSLENHVMNYT